MGGIIADRAFERAPTRLIVRFARDEPPRERASLASDPAARKLAGGGIQGQPLSLQGANGSARTRGPMTGSRDEAIQCPPSFSRVPDAAQRVFSGAPQRDLCSHDGPRISNAPRRKTRRAASHPGHDTNSTINRPARERVLAAKFVRALHQNCPSENRGRRESRMPECTRSLACRMKKHTSKSTTGTPVHAGLPCANGVTAYSVLSPVSVTC